MKILRRMMAAIAGAILLIGAVSLTSSPGFAIPFSSPKIREEKGTQVSPSPNIGEGDQGGEAYTSFLRRLPTTSAVPSKIPPPVRAGVFNPPKRDAPCPPCGSARRPATTRQGKPPTVETFPEPSQGLITGDTTLYPEDNPHVFLEDLEVPAGTTLTITPGCELRFGPNAAFIIRGRLWAEGAPTQTIRMTNHDPDHYWSRIVFARAEARNRIAYAEIDSFHGLYAQYSEIELLHSEISYVNEDAVVATGGRALIQHNHIHHAGYDTSAEGIQIRDTPPEQAAYILDNHIHHVNDDCIDINDSSVIIERNHIHDCYDKGISLGTAHETPPPEYNPMVGRMVNNLVYASDIGIAVKDTATATLLHNTLVGNETGLALYEVPEHYDWGGGRAHAANNIIWGNTEAAIEVDETTHPPSELTITHSDIEGDWPGEANVDVDPGFRGAGDYRLGEDSPLIDIGVDAGVMQDLDGQPRPIGPAPDLGAYEAQTRLSLTARPGDRRLDLRWRATGMPATLASFAISTTYRMEKSLTLIIAPPPITGLLTTTRAYTLTGLVNYTPHTVTVEARDAEGQMLYHSPPVAATPTDIFVYLPTILNSCKGSQVVAGVPPSHTSATQTLRKVLLPHPCEGCK